MSHVTVRMAWHDRGWDGHTCDDPSINTFCTGSHSLLSERIAREKCLATEQANKGKKLDESLPDYLPPCFWSSCAFSNSKTSIVHRHPFSQFQTSKKISETLPPNSVYTWPFRLAMVHSNKSFKRQGKYFSDLEERINRYCGRLQINRSLVFFYLNYDNPVSAEEYRYALVGCARLTDIAIGNHFEFSDDELAMLRRQKGMQNFPTLNWALRLTHGGEGHVVRLPYQEYLAHIANNPGDEEKLEQVRVLIEEPALVPGFKYVSEQLSDDHALALLYKLKRAFVSVDEHGITEVGDAPDLINEYIEDLWTSRGLYPGLGSVVSVLADLAQGEPRIENYTGQDLVDFLRKENPTTDPLEQTFALLSGKGAPPTNVAEHKRTIRNARAGLRDNKSLEPVLRKLSLFSLTPRQISRIVYPDSDTVHAFGGRNIQPCEIAKNPFLLAESYQPATQQPTESSTDLDREQRSDGPIDYFSIDVGLFPDDEYIEPNDDLHDLTVACPERLRAFAMETLRRNEEIGHSFSPLSKLVEDAKSHPLFYRDSLALAEHQFLDADHLAHFRLRLFVREQDKQFFFYLQETKDSEEIVARFINERIERQDLTEDVSWVRQHLKKESSKLSAEIDEFNDQGFLSERRRAMEGMLTRPIYCITGRPGSGKTQALQAVLGHLEKIGERCTVLAPTGKAALRLNSEFENRSNWQAETLDRWIVRSGLYSYLHRGRPLTSMDRSNRWEDTDNIVMDEMSMVDLRRLAIVFHAMEVHQPNLINRVILVGDENQLPPIGCGRPFHDIIGFLRRDQNREQRNVVRLTTNCRQKHDRTVLDAAHLFAGKNRYHSDLLDQLLAGGKLSKYLNVQYWEDVDELQHLVSVFIDETLELTSSKEGFTTEERFNSLLGLYQNGFVPKSSAKDLKLDRAQLLTPYRAGQSGSLGISEFIRTQYRTSARSTQPQYHSAFLHSDKIIRLTNYYEYDRESERQVLRLSNGSIGVLCNHPGKQGRRAYFPETKWPQKWKKFEEEDFELAYGITVHKAQGSEFEELLVVLPERRALLSRELLYTALTRSKTRLTLLVQRSLDLNPLQVARDRSEVMLRNSSIFEAPFDSRLLLEPEKGVRVRSKIEYLIYKELQRARDAGELAFGYENPLELPIDGKPISVKPDFTVQCGGKTYYWEHLGMLDREDYNRNWQSRFKGYEAAGIADRLVTTDDLGGVRQESLTEVIVALTKGEFTNTATSTYSMHHYSL